MKRILKRGDMVVDCGHLDSANDPDQPIRVMHLTSGVVYWTTEDGERERVPCEWLIACVPCYTAAGANPRNVSIPTRPAPHDSDDVNLDDAEATPPLEQLPEEQIEALADMLGEDVADIGTHDRRRILGALVAREFTEETGEEFAAWFLAADAVRMRYARDLEPAGSWSPVNVPTIGPDGKIVPKEKP